MGGATPTIVPFSLLGGPAAPTDMGPVGRGAAPGTAEAMPAGAGVAAGGAGGAGGAPAGWFIMSIVPLNFGAEAPFRLKEHLEHVCAVSGF